MHTKKFLLLLLLPFTISLTQITYASEEAQITMTVPRVLITSATKAFASVDKAGADVSATTGSLMDGSFAKAIGSELVNGFKKIIPGTLVGIAALAGVIWGSNKALKGIERTLDSREKLINLKKDQKSLDTELYRYNKAKRDIYLGGGTVLASSLFMAGSAYLLFRLK